MPRRRKTTTRDMDETEQKIAGMKSIDENLDLGGGLSVAAVEAALAETRAALEDYNLTLALSDEKLNVFKAKEKVMRALRKRVLPAVGVKHGIDSNEYEKVGGIRESERAKPVRKPKP